MDWSDKYGTECGVATATTAKSELILIISKDAPEYLVKQLINYNGDPCRTILFAWIINMRQSCTREEERSFRSGWFLLEGCLPSRTT